MPRPRCSGGHTTPRDGGQGWVGKFRGSGSRVAYARASSIAWDCACESRQPDGGAVPRDDPRSDVPVILLVFMYHRARAGRHGNAADVLDAHFRHIAANYNSVLPGDPLAPSTNVCLTFDDAYFDFYATVFPLLKKHNVRALLAVPPAVIREDVAARPLERIAVESDAAFADPDKGGFCTWPELAEMTRSGQVRVAAHGLTHCRLDRPGVDLEREVDEPQTVLRARLGREVENFVFPFGRYDDASLHRAGKRYRHVFRIGGAANPGWGRRLLYRIDADQMETPTSLLAGPRRLRYRARYFWNRLRGR